MKVANKYSFRLLQIVANTIMTSQRFLKLLRKNGEKNLIIRKPLKVNHALRSQKSSKWCIFKSFLLMYSSVEMCGKAFNAHLRSSFFEEKKKTINQSLVVTSSQASEGVKCSQVHYLGTGFPLSKTPFSSF